MSSTADHRPVVVTGSGGALAQELINQLNLAGLSVAAFGRSNLDVSMDLNALVAMLEKIAPRAVLNCLALTGLDKCYRDPGQAFEANGLFPMKLAMASKVLKLPVIQFSTENVFACNINGLTYREADQTIPTTLYGLSKLVGEAEALRGQALFHVVRLPLMYGPTNRKQIVARFVRELLRGNEITAASDVYSTPVFTPDVAAVVVDWLLERRKLQPVTHLTSGHRASLYELICVIAKGIEAKGKIQSTLSSRFPSLELKPLHGGLASEMTDLLPWDGAIGRYVDWIKLNEKAIVNES